jgi:uncharacterized OsmC-like protein
MTVRQHVNIEKLEEFRTFLKENPDKGKLHLEVKALYEGEVGRSTVHIGRFGIDDEIIDRETRHYTLPFGAWREIEELTGLEGPTDRLEPVEVALAATAACLVNSVTYNAARMGINTEGLEVHIKSVVDPRVLLAIKEPSAHSECLGALEYDVTVPDDLSDSEMKTIKDLCAYSPVHGLIAESIKTSCHVHRTEKKTARSH